MVRSSIEPGRSLPRCASLGDVAHRVDELGAAAVVERERERHAPVLRGERLGVGDVLTAPAPAPAHRAGR